MGARGSTSHHHHHHHGRHKKRSRESTLSSGRRGDAGGCPGTAHTTPVTQHASSRHAASSLGDSTTTPSNTYCHIPPDGDALLGPAAANGATAAPDIFQNRRKSSRFSLPEAQLYCAVARLQDPQMRCDCLQDHSVHNVVSTLQHQAAETMSSMELQQEEEKNDAVSSSGGIVLKTMKPYRSYSLRLSRNSSSTRPLVQDSSFSNGPSTRTNYSYFAGPQPPSSIHQDSANKKYPNGQATSKPEARPDLVVTSTSGCVYSDTCQQETSSLPSSESGCSDEDVHSELEDVIMTTAC